MVGTSGAHFTPLHILLSYSRQSLCFDAQGAEAMLPALGDTDAAAGEAHKPGDGQNPDPLLGSFALRLQEGKTKGGKGSVEKDPRKRQHTMSSVVVRS